MSMSTKTNPESTNAYIEILSAVMMSRRELQWGLGFIEFTRENILEWMKGQTGPEWVGLLPAEDFHAVCGDIDIPWAREESRLLWTRVAVPFYENHVA